MFLLEGESKCILSPIFCLNASTMYTLIFLSHLLRYEDMTFGSIFRSAKRLISAKYLFGEAKIRFFIHSFIHSFSVNRSITHSLTHSHSLYNSFIHSFFIYFFLFIYSLTHLFSNENTFPYLMLKLFYSYMLIIVYHEIVSGFLFPGLSLPRPEVCHGRYGCFGLHPNLLVFFPQAPSQVGTTFHLYTRNNRQTSQVIDDSDVNKLRNSFFNIFRRTIFIIHGFRS